MWDMNRMNHVPIPLLFSIAGPLKQFCIVSQSIYHKICLESAMIRHSSKHECIWLVCLMLLRHFKAIRISADKVNRSYPWTSSIPACGWSCPLWRYGPQSNSNRRSSLKCFFTPLHCTCWWTDVNDSDVMKPSGFSTRGYNKGYCRFQVLLFKETKSCVPLLKMVPTPKI